MGKLMSSPKFYKAAEENIVYPQLYVTATLWLNNNRSLFYFRIIFIIEKRPGPEVIKLFSCSTQLSMEF